MRRRPWLLLAAWLLALPGLSPLGALAAQRLQVVVSVLPLQWLVDQVGGEAVAAHTLVGPGRSPHTYEPTPRQMVELSRARLFVRVGVPFEHSLVDRIRAANPGISMLDVRDGLRLRAMEGAEQLLGEAKPGAHRPGQAADEALDPHVWTSPANLIHMAGRLRDRLAALDPDNASAYAQRYRVLAQSLAALDRDIRTRLQGRTVRVLMVFHPSWGYFADAYGLEQLPLEHEGKTPGPRSLAALVERARREGVRKIFVQPQIDQRSARTLASAIGARLVTVDPLAYDVPASLRTLAEQIGSAP